MQRNTAREVESVKYDNMRDIINEYNRIIILIEEGEITYEDDIYIEISYMMNEVMRGE